MERLPAAYREILLLREVEELAYQDIAEMTGTPIGTVMSRLSRARLGAAQAVAGEARDVGGRSMESDRAPSAVAAARRRTGTVRALAHAPPVAGCPPARRGWRSCGPCRGRSAPN